MTTDATMDSAAPPRDGEQLDLAALDAWLATAVPALHGALSYAQFPSGHSNLTYLLRKGDAELVLRRGPFGAQVKTGHDMDREFRVLSALHPSPPATPLFAAAPRAIAQCTDPAVLGAPFYLMERRAGVILRRKLPSELGVTPTMLRQMCASLVDRLADLHAIDVGIPAVAALGKPEGYVRRQVEGWIGRWQKARTDDVPDIDALGRWLVDHMPADTAPSVVHNDYKFDNVVLDPNDLTRIDAVLDWEMCTLGDPLMDLGTTLGYWAQTDDDPAWQAMAFGPTMAPGAMRRSELVDHYAARTGRDVSNMLYYYAFALLKIAVIVQQIYFRYRNGFTKDPRFAGFDRIVIVLGRTAVAALERGHLGGA